MQYEYSTITARHFSVKKKITVGALIVVLLAAVILYFHYQGDIQYFFSKERKVDSYLASYGINVTKINGYGGTEDLVARALNVGAGPSANPKADQEAAYKYVYLLLLTQDSNEKQEMSKKAIIDCSKTAGLDATEPFPDKDELAAKYNVYSTTIANFKGKQLGFTTDLPRLVTVCTVFKKSNLEKPVYAFIQLNGPYPTFFIPINLSLEDFNKACDQYKNYDG